MKTATVNISFNKDLLEQIDRIALSEFRSRSELIREAARMYIGRKDKWERIFEYGNSRAKELGLKDEEILSEIKQNRREKKKTRV